MTELLKQPWPWYLSGSLIGLTVPLLLIMGNKSFGVSASFRQVCAACFPANISLFTYNWKKDAWNLFFVAGICLGGFLATVFASPSHPIDVHPELAKQLASYHIDTDAGAVPQQLFSFRSLFSARGFIMMIGGGFLIGFGSRYAGSCTSGHAIMGISTLQWPSLVATFCFIVGGTLMTNLLLPFILQL